MQYEYWITFYCLLALVCAQPSEDEDQCDNCVGEGYECINGLCSCANGFIQNRIQPNSCVRCPGLEEKCHRTCCYTFGNGSLQCWHGICQHCYDSRGNWICRDALDQILLISITQVVMATALILGIIATFALLYKLCAASSLRPLGNRSGDSRLSIGSLQLYIEQRLRDAPPRYSRTTPAGLTIHPSPLHTNAGFVHDSSIPPPPYTPERKNEENLNTAVHI